MFNLNKLFFKFIFESALFLRRESFGHLIQEYKNNETLPLQELQALQIEKLNTLLNHARTKSDFYRKRLPASIKKLSDLNAVETIDKETLRDQYDTLIAKKSIFDRVKTSGGSTGAPVTIIKDNKAISREMAAAWRGYSWANIEIGDKQARFWGNPRGQKDRTRTKLIDFLGHRKRYSAFNFNRDTFEECINSLHSFKPDYFYGYTSIIEELCLHIRSKDEVYDYNLKSIITTSEALSEPTRKNIENIFNCKVHDEYGCGEIGTIAHECEQQRLHINMENVIVEVADEKGNQVPEGTPGQLIITDLTNFAMPLIRYKIMDFATISTSACSCGRTLQTIEKVHGRAYDHLINSSGRKFHGEFFLYIAEDARKVGLEISGIQFIQKRILALEINIVCREDQRTEIMDFFTSRIINDFDRKIIVTYVWTDQIPREKSGKLRVVKNECHF